MIYYLLSIKHNKWQVESRNVLFTFAIGHFGSFDLIFRGCFRVGQNYLFFLKLSLKNDKVIKRYFNIDKFLKLLIPSNKKKLLLNSLHVKWKFSSFNFFISALPFSFLLPTSARQDEVPKHCFLIFFFNFEYQYSSFYILYENSYKYV